MRKSTYSVEEVMHSLNSKDYETVYHQKLRKNEIGDTHRDAFIGCGEYGDVLI